MSGCIKLRLRLRLKLYQLEIAFDTTGSQATITMSDATGSPESDPAFVVHLTDESITWVSAQSKATEVWTYVATNHILIYSQQSPRAGTDLSELTPGSGAFGDVMFSTCHEGIK
ncbi:hypothetical protein PTKU15_92920 [Paraburkholderia terrae]|nr:hypothetical protein PTKU15_92920 [Paraburkholderia terrae]